MQSMFPGLSQGVLPTRMANVSPREEEGDGDGERAREPVGARARVGARVGARGWACLA